MAPGLSAGVLQGIDWDVPWLQPWRSAGQAVAAGVVAGGDGVAAALNQAAGAALPVRFVPQSELPRQQAYEEYVATRSRVPTRDGLHDFFNGLCWLNFPLTKQRLNRIHAAELACQGVGPRRGAVRDAATVFDENGAVLCGPDLLWQALHGRQWQRLFGDLRPLWAHAQLLLFGHALLEKLVQPRVAITAHVLRGPSAPMRQESLDSWLSEYVSANKFAMKPFSPLPVLGVPGWWPPNEAAGFYDDDRVFRSVA